MALQGVGNPRQDEERQFSDRVQDYDVYNDLSRLPQNPKPDDVPDIRPILGGSVRHQGGIDTSLRDRAKFQEPDLSACVPTPLKTHAGHFWHKSPVGMDPQHHEFITSAGGLHATVALRWT